MSRNGHGGARISAGRLPGKRNEASMRRANIVEKAISFELRCRLLAELAKGILLEKTDKKDGSKQVFLQPPSIDAIRELNDRQFGRPHQGIAFNPGEEKELPPYVIFALPVPGSLPGPNGDMNRQSIPKVVRA